MKIAITGKGGTGKTTLAVLLSRYFADNGREVVLIDCDPDANAAMTLGLPEAEEPSPIIELEELIEERTGAGGPGQYFSLNPRVDDIPDRFSVEADGVKLLRMGRLKKGGGGCMCPENAFVRSLMSHLVFQQDQAIVLDMEAGVEHLGRGTAQGVDIMLVVVTPGRRSIQTARQIRELARQIGVKNVAAVINQYMPDQDLDPVEHQLNGIPVVARIPYDESIAAADIERTCPYTGSEQQREWIDSLLSAISSRINEPA
jgi:CO dehydrogenase maturation factor